MFLATYVLGLILLAEGGSYLALSYLEGRATSSDSVRGRMQDIAGMQGARRTSGYGRAGRVVHPYLGFLMPSWVRDPEDMARIDSPGFYAPGSPIHERDPDTLVIGLSGGSLATDFAHRQGMQTLAQHLARQPRFAGKRFRYVALAAGGWKQPQQLMALNYLLALGGHVDLLVDLGGFNEVVLHELENQDQGIAPIYPRAWYFMSRREEVGADLERLERLHQERVGAARTALASPLRRLWTYRLWWRLRDGRMAHDDRELQKQLHGLRDDLQPRNARDVIELGPRASGADRAARLDELIGIWERCTLQMRSLCEANGIEFFACLQPNQYVPDSKPLSETELERAFDPNSHSIRPLVLEGYPRLRAAGERLRAERGLRFSDLTQVFADEREDVYVDQCCHVNARGDELIAEAIARAIQAELP